MHTWKSILKMSLYVIVSGVISFISLLDTLNVEHINDISNMEWIKIVFKSILPGLVSVRAFLDTSFIDNKKDSNENKVEIN